MPLLEAIRKALVKADPAAIEMVLSIVGRSKLVDMTEDEVFTLKKLLGAK